MISNLDGRSSNERIVYLYLQITKTYLRIVSPMLIIPFSLNQQLVRYYFILILNYVMTIKLELEI